MLSGWWGFLSSGCEKPACTPMLAHCWLEDSHISNLHMVWPESESMRSLTQCPETPPLNVIVQFETCVDVESISYYLFIYFPLLVRFNCRIEMHVLIQSDRKYTKSHFDVQQTTSYTFLDGYNITSSGSEFFKLLLNLNLLRKHFQKYY